jgi:hypothetical protein
MINASKLIYPRYRCYLLGIDRCLYFWGLIFSFLLIRALITHFERIFEIFFGSQTRCASLEEAALGAGVRLRDRFEVSNGKFLAKQMRCVPFRLIRSNMILLILLHLVINVRGGIDVKHLMNSLVEVDQSVVFCDYNANIFGCIDPLVQHL